MQSAIELTALTKTYELKRGVNHAVLDLNLSVKPGVVFGFLGPNGAGKTTTIKMLVNLIQPTSGSALIFGHRAGTLEAAKKIGYLPENPTFYRYLSGLELVIMHGQLMGQTKKQAQTTATELLETVGLTKAKHRSIKEYSKGMVQRLGLAQALIGNPEVVLLDEPLDGLDAFARPEIKTILIKLRSQKKTVVFSSHILSDVEEICDEIGIIDQGKLIEVGQTKTIMKKGGTLEQYFVKRITASRKSSHV